MEMMETMQMKIGKKYSRAELSKLGIHCLRQRTCGMADAFADGTTYAFGLRPAHNGEDYYELLGETRE